jgi:cell division protein ZipA
MEDTFRNTLIIISGVVIAAIFIHGLWTIRKQKNPYKLKTSKEQIKPLARDFDGKGFDQDGVGQVKILKQENEPEVNSEQDFEQAISLEEISHLESGLNEDSYPDITSQEQVVEHEIAIETPQKTSEPSQELEEIILEPLYQQPVTQAKPDVNKVKKAPIRKKPNKAKSAQAEIKRNQMEINFGDGIEVDDNTQIEQQGLSLNDEQSLAQPQKQKKSDIEPQIIILSVVMPANQLMSGAALLPSLLTLGMKYGEMDIFHRHQDSAGNGGVSFSLANMLNPGSFDLDTMETFATQGVSLFMALPNAVDAFAAFDQMLAAAKQLAAEFNAQVLDDKRNLLTKQAEQHYISRIREFDRQYRLASVE